jgi:hypothetical protein
MRIDLAEYAEDGEVGEDTTLLRWIALKVSRRSDAGEITPSSMASWMRAWPWILVLDGLDEVTEPKTRRRLITHVIEFVNEAEAVDCDLFVVLTTRPMGYTEDISPHHFERIDLDYLTPREAVEFGSRATRVRLGSDDERIDRVVTHLTRAAGDDALRNLLRTPLQVLILTIIVDSAGRLAPDRFRLFWGYYEAVFRREQAKSGWLQQLLRDHQPLIQLLHERVGFELQVRSEAAERSLATLSTEELQSLIWHVLADSGFDPGGKDSRLLTSFFNAATQRLVLLVPRGDDGYGFDVRSLQELMAAKHLASGALEQTLERLRVAMPNPHWRNTWLFAAGALFSEPRDFQQSAVVELVESGDLSAPERLGRVAPVTHRLALDMLDDGMARSVPKFRDRLARHGLQFLMEETGGDLPTLARIVMRFADLGDHEQLIVADALREALAADQRSRQSASAVMALVSPLAEELGLSRRVLGLNMVTAPEASAEAGPVPDRWDRFEAELGTYPGPLDWQVMLADAGSALTRLVQRGWTEENDPMAEEYPELVEILTVLDVPELALELETALQPLVRDEPDLQRVLRATVLTALHRSSIGEVLRG